MAWLPQAWGLHLGEDRVAEWPAVDIGQPGVAGAVQGELAVVLDHQLLQVLDVVLGHVHLDGEALWLCRGVAAHALYFVEAGLDGSGWATHCLDCDVADAVHEASKLN